MRNACLLAITLLLFTITVPSTTVAQDHPLGLQWGTSVGEHYVYDFRVVAHVNLNCRIEVEVTALREIPAYPDILDFETILSSGVAFYTNGSVLDWNDQPPFKVIPVGNWSYVSSIYEDCYGTSPNFEIINTTTSWGFSYGDLEFQQKVVFNKVSGVMVSYHQEHRDVNGDLISLRELSPPSDIPVILVIGTSVLLAIVIVWYFRGRKLKTS